VILLYNNFSAIKQKETIIFHGLTLLELSDKRAIEGIFQRFTAALNCAHLDISVLSSDSGGQFSGPLSLGPFSISLMK